MRELHSSSVTGSISAGVGELDALAEPIAWQPAPEDIARSRLRRFMHRHGISDLDALIDRAAADPAWFWPAVIADLGLEFYRPWQQVLDLSRGLPWARWFVGAQYNYVHNALDKHAAGPQRDATALIWEGEDGTVRRYSFHELWQETNRAAHALRSLGVGRGDRVGIYLPMIPEAIIVSLACSKIGAIFTPIFSGFGAPAVASRLQDAGAVLLITADGYYRRGRLVEMKPVADAAAAQAGVVRKLVVCHAGNAVPWEAKRDVWWDEAVSGQPGLYETERTDAEDPYMIIYTSGTTGRPKGALHVHAGFPLKAAQDLAHCFDLDQGDTLFWLTDMGWMMGPWAVAGGLSLGATLVAYDGAPDYPQPDRLWSLVERHRITVLGISPTAVRALMRVSDEWVERHDLSSLRLLGSTGEPWNPAPWRWYFEKIGRGRCPIINYSGGTEISGGILGCTVLRPLKPCAFNLPVPGMHVDVVDEEGKSVRGRVGELVLRGPWPGMTRGFWNDPQRYLETYWSRFPNVWVHGDWALVDRDGFWYILGRSDDTIKVAGKRIGPAEVESAVVAHPAVSEAAAIGAPHPVKGEAIVVFAILKPGWLPGEVLREEIKQCVAERLGKPLAPDEVKFVRDLPRTRNAKILRRVIRGAYLGAGDLGDLSALENPAAVEEIRRAR
jgi:acetyl-CoA synthetase